jgi:hypothetical protein
MKIWLRLVVSLAALAVLPRDPFAADASHPTVVELFESQGCSDCPPAVANVAAISDRADVLVLVFAVDYWDRLGWKDTFSKPECTAQRAAVRDRTLTRLMTYSPTRITAGQFRDRRGAVPGQWVRTALVRAGAACRSGLRVPEEEVGTWR